MSQIADVILMMFKKRGGGRGRGRERKREKEREKERKREREKERKRERERERERGETFKVSHSLKETGMRKGEIEIKYN